MADQMNAVTTTVEKPRPPALNILNELSVGTYVSYSRALKELLSNSWDAGAHNVQIKIASDLSEITILNDGTGMSEEDIRERFLRLEGSSSSRGAARQERRLNGHKGIGALSVIPICREVRVLTTKAGSTDRVEAALDISKIIEKAKQQEKLGHASKTKLQLERGRNEILAQIDASQRLCLIGILRAQATLNRRHPPFHKIVCALGFLYVGEQHLRLRPLLKPLTGRR